MPLTPAGQAMNVSARTLGDLQTLAKAEPKTATDYLTKVEQHLRTSGKTAEADTLKALLGKTGDLVERMAAAGDSLKAIFPASAADWGQVQLQRAGTVGFEATPAPPPPPAQFISGTLKQGTDGLTFTTDGGRELKLGQSELARIPLQMANDMMEGFIGDGPMVLQGTFGEDLNTFNVESYALNTDGKFGTFTFGRVAIEGDQVTVGTSRGPVEVLDPELKKVLTGFPKLAVILPGGPEERDGKLVHSGKSEGVLMALARFKEPPPATATGPTTAVKANMADNHFVMKPLAFPSEQLARSNHMSRLWVRGWPEFGADGQPSQFNANYLSKQLDQRTLRTGQQAPLADHVQASVMQEIV